MLEAAWLFSAGAVSLYRMRRPGTAGVSSPFSSPRAGDGCCVDGPAASTRGELAFLGERCGEALRREVLLEVVADLVGEGLWALRALYGQLSSETTPVQREAHVLLTPANKDPEGRKLALLRGAATCG